MLLQKCAMLVQGPDLAIHHPDSVLGEMNSWCIEHHGESGLTQRCRESTLSMEEAESQVSSNALRSSQNMGSLRHPLSPST